MFRIPLFLVVISLSWLGVANAQSIGFYSDLQFNTSSGDVSTYATTWSDYSTYYYYDVYVYSQLNVSQNGGPFQITCQTNGYGYNSDAVATCNTNVGTGTVDLELISTHTVTATYYVYQFDYYCYYDCYYYWDAFSTSLMGAQGQIYYDTNAYYFAPGPPAERVPQQQTASGYISRRKSNRLCAFPTGESSWAVGSWSSLYPYAAAFNADLFAGLNNFNNRQIGEFNIELQGDTCWYPGSPYSPMFVSSNGYWTVGTQRNDYGTPVSFFTNTYGHDYIGYTNTSAYYHYRSRMQSSGLQCGMTYQQNMYMDGCGGQSQYYGTPHGLQIYINSFGLTVTRGNASANKY